MIDSPVLKLLFDRTYNFSHEEGNVKEPSRKRRTILYFIVDGTYPKWPLFMKPIGNVTEIKNSRFSEVYMQKLGRVLEHF